jgi:rhodanese-related sulfurtransferase
MNEHPTRISPRALARDLGSARFPRIIDVSRHVTGEGNGRMIPTALWRDAQLAGEWGRELPRAEPVVVACAHGRERSQGAAAVLRSLGLPARSLEGGIEAWLEAGLPTVDAAKVLATTGIWVTRERPKIDRIACPWLLRRFIDRDAVIHYVEPGQTLAVARLLGGTAFDIKGAPLEHDGELCTFDTMLRHFGLDDPTLQALAPIVRGADTHRFDLAPQAAGLLAVSLGLSQLHADDDHAMLAAGMTVYDALYRWYRDAREETHNWPMPAGAA